MQPRSPSLRHRLRKRPGVQIATSARLGRAEVGRWGKIPGREILAVRTWSPLRPIWRARSSGRFRKARVRICFAWRFALLRRKSCVMAHVPLDNRAPIAESGRVNRTKAPCNADAASSSNRQDININKSLYASLSQGGRWSVYTKQGSYSALDSSAPGVDAKGNAHLFAAAPQMLEALSWAEAALSDREAADRKGYTARAAKAVFAVMDSLRKAGVR